MSAILLNFGTFRGLLLYCKVFFGTRRVHPVLLLRVSRACFYRSRPVKVCVSASRWVPSERVPDDTLHQASVTVSGRTSEVSEDPCERSTHLKEVKPDPVNSDTPGISPGARKGDRLAKLRVLIPRASALAHAREEFNVQTCEQPPRRWLWTLEGDCVVIWQSAASKPLSIQIPGYTLS